MFSKFVRALVWRVVTANDASEATLIVRINAICQFSSASCRTCAGSGSSRTRRCEGGFIRYVVCPAGAADAA